MDEHCTCTTELKILSEVFNNAKDIPEQRGLIQELQRYVMHLYGPYLEPPTGQ